MRLRTGVKSYGGGGTVGFGGSPFEPCRSGIVSEVKCPPEVRRELSDVERGCRVRAEPARRTVLQTGNDKQVADRRVRDHVCGFHHHVDTDDHPSERIREHERSAEPFCQVWPREPERISSFTRLERDMIRIRLSGIVQWSEIQIRSQIKAWIPFIRRNQAEIERPGWRPRWKAPFAQELIQTVTGVGMHPKPERISLESFHFLHGQREK